MQRIALSSSVVVSAGYDEDAEMMELEFASGRVYQYRGVPRGTYEWLLRTPSKGGYVARVINDRYPYAEVTQTSSESRGDLLQALRDSLDAGPASER